MSIASNLFWSYFERWANKIVTLVVFVVVARYLSPTQMAVVTFAKLFVDYLDVMAGQGLGYEIIHNKNIEQINLDTAFWGTVSIGSLFAILIFVFAPLIKLFNPGYHDLELVLRLLSITIIINSLSRVQVALLIKNQEFKKLSLRNFVQVVIGGITGVILAIKGYGALSIVYQSLVGSLLALVFLWFTTSWRPSFNYSISVAKSSFSYTSKIILDQNILFFSKRLDEIVIGIFLSPISLGLYGVAKRIYFTFEEMFFSVISKVVLSAFSKDKNKDQSVLRVKGMITLLGVVLFPIFFLVALLSKPFLIVFFGIQWAEASVPLSIMMLSGVFLLIPNIVHPLYLAHGDSKTPLKLNTYRATVSALLTPFASFLGLNGVAFVMVIRNLSSSILDLNSLNKSYNAEVRFFFTAFSKACAISFPMILVVSGTYSLINTKLETIYVLSICSVAGIFVYLITLFLFEKNIVNNILVRLKFKSRK